jgi:hypothetical protein
MFVSSKTSDVGAKQRGTSFVYWKVEIYLGYFIAVEVVTYLSDMVRNKRVCGG